MEKTCPGCKGHRYSQTNFNEPLHDNLVPRGSVTFVQRPSLHKRIAASGNEIVYMSQLQPIGLAHAQIIVSKTSLTESISDKRTEKKKPFLLTLQIII